jgi:long-chain acyl-CoA synthetase
VRLIDSVQPRVLFCDGERLQRLEPDLARWAATSSLPARRPTRRVGCSVSTQCLRPADRRASRWAPQPDDPALLLFTSGASARPKAVLSSHRAVCQAIFNIDFIGALSGMTSPARRWLR